MVFFFGSEIPLSTSWLRARALPFFSENMLALAQCASGLTASGIILQRATARAASLPTTLLRQKQTIILKLRAQHRDSFLFFLLLNFFIFSVAGKKKKNEEAQKTRKSTKNEEAQKRGQNYKTRKNI